LLIRLCYQAAAETKADILLRVEIRDAAGQLLLPGTPVYLNFNSQGKEKVINEARSKALRSSADSFFRRIRRMGG
jgi:hypothetical protein